MTAKIRNLKRVFAQEYKSNFKNLLVSGGSYVWNNSEQHAVTWPYYLKEIAGFTEVYDCSQGASSITHVFNSVINEIETTKDFDAEDTLIILMLNEFITTEIIAASQDIPKLWIPGENYNFNDKYSTLTLFKEFDSNSDKAKSSLGKLCVEYAKHLDWGAQIYENLIKLRALRAYLNEKKFSYVLLSAQTSNLQEVNDCVVHIETLEDWTERHQMRVPNDGHPTPDAHLAWTREILIPYLNKKNIIETL